MFTLFTHDPTHEQPISPCLGDNHPDTWHRSHQCCWCRMVCSATLCSHSYEEWNAIIQRKLCCRVTSDANGSIVLLHRSTTISLLLALHGNRRMRLRGMLATNSLGFLWRSTNEVATLTVLLPNRFICQLFNTIFWITFGLSTVKLTACIFWMSMHGMPYTSSLRM